MTLVGSAQSRTRAQGRAKAFYAIARRRPDTFHVNRPPSSPMPTARLRHYLRIERGLFA